MPLSIFVAVVIHKPPASVFLQETSECRRRDTIDRIIKQIAYIVITVHSEHPLKPEPRRGASLLPAETHQASACRRRKDSFIV